MIGNMMKFNEEIFNNLRVQCSNDENRRIYFHIRKEISKYGRCFRTSNAKTIEVAETTKLFLKDVAEAKKVKFLAFECRLYGEYTNSAIKEGFQNNPGIAYIKCEDWDGEDAMSINHLDNSFVTFIQRILK